MKLVVLIFLFWTLAVFAIFQGKHFREYQTFGLDTGFFDQLIYEASKGNFTVSTISQWSLWTDHFEPILLAFVPLYWLTPNINWLFLGEAAVFAASIFPLYLLAKKVTSSQLFSYSLIIAYLFLVPTQHGLFDGFASQVFVAPFLALAYWALESKKNKLLIFSLVGLFLVKEEFSLLIAGLGMIAFLFYKRRRLGVLMMLAGMAGFVFLTRVFDPWISPGNLNYAHQNVGYGQALNILARPYLIPLAYVDSPIKLQTMLTHFAGFAFLPLLSPINLLLLFEQYGQRFINTSEPLKWLAHDFAFGPILLISAAYGVGKVAGRKAVALSLLVVVVALAGDLLLHGPVNSLLKPDFYQTPSWAKDNNQILALVPAGTSVAANNSLVAHLSERPQIYLLPNVNRADYVVADLHGGPNAYAPIDQETTRSLVSWLVSSRQYQQVAKIGQAVLLKRT
ncbi:MAG: DUF2079 domain-containing protein [Patescibacteria group bacterium]|nr:DUF2079 domain-containing protein [Patescibacteria group bacterium]MCL5431690.1 DUF2079 domain-containing protein [Patescibacteria group bacterium]